MTEKEKMLSGMKYNALDKDLIAELNIVKDKLMQYNHIPPTRLDERKALIKQILGKTGERVFINQPFYCDYGKHIEVGDGFFANFNLTILDEAMVRIGKECFIGPNVSIYTACHSTNPTERNTRQEWAKPVTIGDNCWLGGNVVILPGVTIGDNVTIGAGSVVTRDIPSDCVAGGNPCKKIKDIL